MQTADFLFTILFVTFKLLCTVPLHEIHIFEYLIPGFLLQTLKTGTMKKMWKTLGIKHNVKENYQS
jgi:hypothetical protein